MRHGDGRSRWMLADLKSPVDWTDGGRWRFAKPPPIVEAWFNSFDWKEYWERDVRVSTTLMVAPPIPVALLAVDERAMPELSCVTADEWRYVYTGFRLRTDRWVQAWTAQVLVREPA